jgi:glycerol-3-phosphate dehydrogenase
VLSCWAGLRPLVQNAAAGVTAAVSREHTVEIAANGLITAVGGKWTTYRAMSEDVLLHAMAAKRLPAGTSTASVTGDLPILGADSPCNTADLDSAADPDFVRFAVNHEYARCVEDILARRSRALFLDASRAEKLAPTVFNELVRQGLNPLDASSFTLLSRQYLHCP